MSGTLKWRKHVWREYRFKSHERDPLQRFEDAVANAERMANDVHFTALQPMSDGLLCGMTHRGADLLLRFDPGSGSFSSLGFPQVAERLEVKLHRGLTRGVDGNYYFGTASLMSVPECHGTPGGRIFRYDPVAGTFEVLGRPLPGTYIQSICLDETRGRIYGNTWPSRYFFDFDFRSGETVAVYYVENVPEAPPCLDADGLVWSMYGQNYSRYQFMCRYDPDTCDMKWTRIAIPGGVPGEDPIPADDSILWRGCLYFGGKTLARLDPSGDAIEDLGSPVGDSERMPCLTVGPQDCLYGAAGRVGECHLFRYDGNVFQDLGLIGDGAGNACHVAHSVCVLDNRVFVGETDNPERSGYLWEAALSA